jgi:hypothetical protein
MPPAFNLSQDQTLQFDSVCLITLAGIEVILMTPSFSIREHLMFEHTAALGRETLGLRIAPKTRAPAALSLSAHTYRLFHF